MALSMVIQRWCQQISSWRRAAATIRFSAATRFCYSSWVNLPDPGIFHRRGGSSPPSDTTHCPIFSRLSCEYLRVDRHVGPEFVLSGQVGDLEPELFVDGCLHGCLGVADDVA